jgi:hypothetical protein
VRLHVMCVGYERERFSVAECDRIHP